VANLDVVRCSWCGKGWEWDWCGDTVIGLDMF
jgi:hypothetical protein